MSEQELNGWLEEKKFPQFCQQGLTGPGLVHATRDDLFFGFEKVNKVAILNLLGERDKYQETFVSSSSLPPGYCCFVLL